MKKSGKVRACGISVNRWEPCNGIRAVLEGHADAIQTIYNIFNQNPEDAPLPHLPHERCCRDCAGALR